MELSELRAKSTDLLDRLADRLPEDWLGQFREFAFVGEWRLLADNLAAALVRRRIAVTDEEREALTEILYSFSVPSPDYKYIENRDDVLASLTRADTRR